jgi:hypothetical protein
VRVLVERVAAGARRGDLSKAILVRVERGALAPRAPHSAPPFFALQAATGHDASDAVYAKVMKELCGHAAAGNVWRLRLTGLPIASAVGP